MMIDLPAEMKAVFSDYKMNLLQVCKSDDVQTVFQISRNIYEENFDEIRRVYKNRDIKAELALVIGKITDSKYIIEEATDGKERINMCSALENLRRQGVEEGIEKGIERGRKEGKLEIAKVLIRRGQTIDSIADITGLTVEEIEGLARE